MNAIEVYEVLRAIGATHLHHANSVTTSCTFLMQGGLVSRGFAESNRLSQTAQPMSDEIDKAYGIWDCIFLDHVDIHYRARRPNQYGPVLFRFELDRLLRLPPGTDVRVTKRNPIYWRPGEPDSDRYYLTKAELQPNIMFGNFDKMLVIFAPKLVFEEKRADVQLDNPQRHLSSGVDASQHATAKLGTAASIGGIALQVRPHTCQFTCGCQTPQFYANPSEWPQHKVDFYFG